MAVYQGAAAFKRINDIINKEIKVRDKQRQKLQIKNSEIHFSNVSFKYDTTEEKAIKDISLHIKGNHGSFCWS